MLRTYKSKITCSQCHVEFPSETDVLVHSTTAHPPQLFVCDICKTTFLIKAQLRKHIKEHSVHGTAEKLRICQLCPATFSRSHGSKERYNEHMRVAHNQYITKGKRAPAFHLCTCHVCGKIFRARRLLANHLLVHNKDKSFLCDVENCTAKFSQKRYLVRHKKNTHDKNPYPSRKGESNGQHVCGNCGKSFSSMKSISGHLAFCGNYVEPMVEPVITENETINCHLCNKVFRSEESLLKHQKYHTREYKDKMKALYQNKEPVICPQCGVFTKNLAAHLLLHTNKFTCNVCNKVFNRKDYMKVHMRVHTGERPFVCFICGGSFKQKPDMDRHMRKAHNFEPIASKIPS